MSGLKRPSSVAGLQAAVASGRHAPPLDAPAAKVTPEGKPVRITLDVERPKHRYLRQFAFDCDSDMQRVLRALIDEMQGDQELADRVRARVEQ